jgi:ribosomal-protein-alanine N-acetyltransferase
MRVRRATVADADEVAALELEIFGVDGWSRSAVEEELAGPRRHAYVTDDLTGYAVFLEGDVWELLRIAVSPAHRRQGVAKALLEAASPEGRVMLEVAADNEAALSFYVAEGFVAIDRRRRYYRDGADAIVMERKGP